MFAFCNSKVHLATNFYFSSKDHYIKYFQLVYSINISKFKQNNQPNKKNLLTPTTTLASHTCIHTKLHWHLKAASACFHTHCKHKKNDVIPLKSAVIKAPCIHLLKRWGSTEAMKRKTCVLLAHKILKKQRFLNGFFFTRKSLLQQNCFTSFSINKWVLTWCFLSLYPLTNDWIIIAFFSLRLSSWKKGREKNE